MMKLPVNDETILKAALVAIVALTLGWFFAYNIVSEIIGFVLTALMMLGFVAIGRRSKNDFVLAASLVYLADTLIFIVLRYVTGSLSFNVGFGWLFGLLLGLSLFSLKQAPNLAKTLGGFFVLDNLMTFLNIREPLLAIAALSLLVNLLIIAFFYTYLKHMQKRR